MVVRIINKAITTPITRPSPFIISQLPKIITSELIAPLNPLVNPDFQNTGMDIL
ncbi:MAG: hypothetical protein ACJA2S_000072 [Cyclobacteriaceae bacterium]|jgi:hypothetical protein